MTRARGVGASVIAAAVTIACACGGCRGARDADAAPIASAHAGVTVPAGWIAMPAIADAVATAARVPGVTVDGSEAWGEPAMGCYAAWIAMRGGAAAAPEVIAQQIVSGFGGGAGAGSADARAIIVHAASGSASAGTAANPKRVELAFERAPYRGRVRADVGDASVTALACFANAREPAACDASCATMMGGAR